LQEFGRAPDKEFRDAAWAITKPAARASFWKNSLSLGALVRRRKIGEYADHEITSRVAGRPLIARRQAAPEQAGNAEITLFQSA
jgi:hypothetical protein